MASEIKDLIVANITANNIGSGMPSASIDFSDDINLSTNSLLLNNANFYDGVAPTTTKGDLVVHNGSSNIREAVGPNDSKLVADSTTASGIRYQELNYSQLEQVSVPTASSPYFSPVISLTVATTGVWEPIVTLPLNNSNISSIAGGEIIVGETGLYDIYLGVSAGVDSGGNRRNFFGYTINQPLTPRSIGTVNVMCAEYTTDSSQPVSMANQRIAIPLTASDRLTLWYMQSGGTPVSINIGTINFSIKRI